MHSGTSVTFNILLSINGYVAILGGGSVAWSSKKQQVIALSTMEAKYIALTKGVKQLSYGYGASFRNLA